MVITVLKLRTVLDYRLSKHEFIFGALCDPQHHTPFFMNKVDIILSLEATGCKMIVCKIFLSYVLAK